MGLILDAEELEKGLTEKVQELSKELGVPYTGMYVKIYKDPNSDQILYALYLTVGDKFIRFIDIVKEVILKHDRIKIDMLMKGNQLNTFLLLKLTGYAENLKCDMAEISAVVKARSDEDSDVVFAVYRGRKFIEWIPTSEE